MTTALPKENRKYMSDLHFEHSMWKNALAFYTEELQIFTNRLEEVVSKNTSHEMAASAEHFQNHFIREKEVIDILNHDINAHEKTLVEFAKDHPIAVDHVYFDNHTGLEDRMETFAKLWKEMRAEYMDFLRKWM